MNKVIISAAMSLMLFSTSAMALTININKKKSESERVAPSATQPSLPSAPQLPPSPPPPPQVRCIYAEPKCDRQDRIHMERYQNEQQMYSFGQCIRGEKEYNYNFYCTDGDIWMKIDYRRNQADRIDCLDPRSGRFFTARSIAECEKANSRHDDRKEVRKDVNPPKRMRPPDPRNNR